MEFSKRLSDAIGNETVSAFSRRSGIGDSTLRQYLSGKSSPGLDNLIAISETAGVSLLWLATGKGSMHEEPDVPEEILGAKVSPKERAALELFRALSPQEQADFLAKMSIVIDTHHAAAGDETPPATGSGRRLS